jgi:hypothetical protein
MVASALTILNAHQVIAYPTLASLVVIQHKQLEHITILATALLTLSVVHNFVSLMNANQVALLHIILGHSLMAVNALLMMNVYLSYAIKEYVLLLAY